MYKILCMTNGKLITVISPASLAISRVKGSVMENWYGASILPALVVTRGLYKLHYMIGLDQQSINIGMLGWAPLERFGVRYKLKGPVKSTQMITPSLFVGCGYTPINRAAGICLRKNPEYQVWYFESWMNSLQKRLTLRIQRWSKKEQNYIGSGQ